VSAICSNCGSTGRVLLLTVTDHAGTRRVGTCCYDASREKSSAMPAFPVAGRGTTKPARGTQAAPTAQRSLGIDPAAGVRR